MKNLFIAMIVSVCLTLACSVSVANQTTVINNPASISTVTVSPSPLPTDSLKAVRSWVTAEKAVHVRDQASEHGLHLQYLYHGDLVSVHECQVTSETGLWARIDEGWINADFLSPNACLK